MIVCALVCFNIYKFGLSLKLV